MSIERISPARGDGPRIGCVSYLNARPLFDQAQEGMVLDHPSVLASALAAGRLDVALVPVFEWFLHPEYKAVDGVSISCLGPVLSVFLATDGPLNQMRKVRLDAASRTSNHLVQVLLADRQDMEFEFATGPLPPEQEEGVLLIGDPALSFRRIHAGGFEYHDLGEWWLRETGLPFVFALWLMGPGVADPGALADKLRRMAAEGAQRLEEIVADEEDPAFARSYLTEHIRHGLGPDEKEGLAEFGRRLFAAGLLANAPDAQCYW